MADDLYERYKAALRDGHVALLRGTLEDAALAYRAASLIAPSRALPHASLGGVHLRLGQLVEALSEYAAAVALAPHDEGALLGQAEVLTMVGQKTAAALTLDRVADVQEASGRLPEASDTLRRAMELEDSTERLQRQRALQREIRLSVGAQAAEKMLTRALRPREDAAQALSAKPGPARSAGYSAGPRVRISPDDEELPPLDDADEPAPTVRSAPRVAAAEPASDPRPETGAARRPEQGSDGEPQPLPEPAAEGDPLPAPAPEPLPVMAEPDPAAPSGDELQAEAEAAEAAGDQAGFRSGLVAAARAYAEEGRSEAALEAVHRLLTRHPGDMEVHLLLVDLYVARNWDPLAVDKLVLLERLANLDGDTDTHERLCSIAARSFPDEPRLAAICA
jgi:tetratricopeptide (TPR) repeat protein